MPNKRITKKQNKQELLRRTQPNKADIIKARSNINNVSRETKRKNPTYKELQQVEIIREKETRQAKQKKRYDRLIANRTAKVRAIAEYGIDPTTIPVKQIDKIKLKDLHNLSASDYPFLFDFNRKYKLKDNKRLYLAFRDYQGEKNLDTLLKEYSRLSNEQLLKRLETLAHTYPTYSKSSGTGSSGSAGDYRMTWAKQNVISDYQAETYNANRRRATQKHKGQYKGYQVMKDGRNNSYAEVSARGLLVTMNAFMENITEIDRGIFYRDMYDNIKYHVPELAKILPEPL